MAARCKGASAARQTREHSMIGELEIIPGWDGENVFAVMIWDRHRDAGFIAQTFPSRQLAVEFALGMAEASSMEFPSAQIIPLAGGAV